MTIDIRFPDGPEVPEELPVLVALPHRWDREAVQALGARVGVEGEALDLGAWYVVRGDRVAIEVYQSSNSFRFSREDIDGEARDGTSVHLDADRAVAVAERFLQRVGRPDAAANVHSVTELEVRSEGRGNGQPSRRVAGRQVNFRFSVEGLALVGPGAKMQVTVGNDDEVIGAYRFWRDVAARGSVASVPVERAYDRFAQSALFADLTNDNASAEVTSTDFGYLCLPPTERQSMLFPVYRLRGSISTELLDQSQFVFYLAATELDGRGSKGERARQARPSLILA